MMGEEFTLFPDIQTVPVFPSTRYQGSKQKFIDWIWMCIKHLKFDTALDAFGGTGCVAYRLKQEGKAVVYNDILSFNSVIGKALIENETVTLSESEVDKLLENLSYDEYPHFIENTFKDVYFTDEENRWLDMVSFSIRQMDDEYKQALAYFGDNDDVISKYNNAQRRFEQNFPKWEIWFEHLLVNHMFFEQFPFQDRPLGLWEEYVGISAVYSLLRFLAIGYMANHNGEESFVDMASAVFRLVDHTDFDLFAAELLKDLNCNTPQKIFDLIVL